MNNAELEDHVKKVDQWLNDNAQVFPESKSMALFDFDVDRRFLRRTFFVTIPASSQR